MKAAAICSDSTNPDYALPATRRSSSGYRELYLNCDQLAEGNLRGLVRQYLAFRPTVLLADGAVLLSMIERLSADNIELPVLRSVITTGKYSDLDARRRIEGYFGSPVFHRYASPELSIIASECDAHQGLHLDAEHLYVEILQDNNAVGSGRSGEIVITDLQNFAFPFIRYRTSDRAVLLEDDCLCGRSLSRLAMAPDDNSR
jgi:phenylacetate-CoA ligase